MSHIYSTQDDAYHRFEREEREAMRGKNGGLALAH